MEVHDARAQHVASADNRVRHEHFPAALQTIEALRDYAAAHDGRPPASLAALTETPAPIDPVTGKVFEYASEGDRATLSSPATTQDRGRAQEAARYELTFER